jgi:hypothetical protein
MVFISLTVSVFWYSIECLRISMQLQLKEKNYLFVIRLPADHDRFILFITFFNLFNQLSGDFERF